MSLFPKVIAIAISPNTENDDVVLSLRLLLRPWRWFRGTSTQKVKEWFRRRYETPYAITANSGRSALFLLLKAFDIGPGDEVIVQAFTCVAVPNSVLWVGAKPIYVDIDDTYNIDIKKLEARISKNTKAIVVQHTFGIPANMEALQRIAEKKHIRIIEDCAHSLGGTLKGRLLGSFGDASFFSFGRDKIISSVFGGAACISKKNVDAGEKLLHLEEDLPKASHSWVFQQLFHPIFFACILPIYATKIGKAMVVLFQKMRMLSFPVYQEEKRGHQPADFPAKYPECLAKLILNQLDKLDRFSNERAAVVGKYLAVFPESRKQIENSLPLLRFPLQVSDTHQIIHDARRFGIYLGNWYQSAIDPVGVEFGAIGYTLGSCPEAESVSKKTINLPTRISASAADRIITLIGKPKHTETI